MTKREEEETERAERERDACHAAEMRAVQLEKDREIEQKAREAAEQREIVLHRKLIE